MFSTRLIPALALLAASTIASASDGETFFDMPDARASVAASVTKKIAPINSPAGRAVAGLIEHRMDLAALLTMESTTPDLDYLDESAVLMASNHFVCAGERVSVRGAALKIDEIDAEVAKAIRANRKFGGRLQAERYANTAAAVNRALAEAHNLKRPSVAVACKAAGVR